MNEDFRNYYRDIQLEFCDDMIRIYEDSIATFEKSKRGQKWMKWGGRLLVVFSGAIAIAGAVTGNWIYAGVGVFIAAINLTTYRSIVEHDEWLDQILAKDYEKRDHYMFERTRLIEDR